MRLTISDSIGTPTSIVTMNNISQDFIHNYDEIFLNDVLSSDASSCLCFGPWTHPLTDAVEG